MKHRSVEVDTTVHDSNVHALLSWFQRFGRDLPWRRNPSPYTVWISEIMLQQTTVPAVVDHYTRWMSRFPDVRTLAAAEEQSIMRLWEGLGYYSRARNILRAALLIVRNHDGVLPSAYEQLIRLPGIGDYTARAVLSLGFGLPYPVVDANIRRIGQRLFAWCEWSSGRNAELKESLRTAIPPESPGEFNEALMELGQTVCLPRAPLCSLCPLEEICLARSLGLQDSIPARVSRRLESKTTVVIVLHRAHRVWVIRRRKSLLEGLWIFPGLPAPEQDGAAAEPDAFPIPVRWCSSIARLAPRTHYYTRFKDTLLPVMCTVETETEAERVITLLRTAAAEHPDTGRWAPLDELDTLPMPSVYREIVVEIERRLADRPG